MTLDISSAERIFCTSTQKSLYNPTGFEPAEFLPESNSRQQNAARYLLHVIEASRVFNHRSRDDWNPLKASYLMRIMGRDYQHVRDTLEWNHAIEVDRRYIQGAKSFGYRLGKNFRDVVFERLSCPVAIAKRLKKHKPPESLTPVHHHLKLWLSKVALDYEKALESLSEKERVEYHTSLMMLKSGDINFTADEFNRVHTNVTNMAKKMRNFLSFNGESLIMLDIKNSQPFFFSVLLSNYYSHNRALESLYNTQVVKTVINEQETTTPPHTPPLRLRFSIMRHRMELLGQLPRDVYEFVRVSEDGTLYEQLVSVFGVKTREQSKKCLIRAVMYNKVRNIKPQIAFASRFPNVWNVMMKLKRKDYRHFSHLLQRAEGAFVIHKVCQRIMEECPEMPILTIHDCLMTTKSYFGRLASIFTEETQLLGLRPKTTVEEL